MEETPLTVNIMERSMNEIVGAIVGGLVGVAIGTAIVYCAALAYYKPRIAAAKAESRRIQAILDDM